MALGFSTKILSTGHPEKRLGKGLAKLFGNQIDFASRSTNPSFDLTLAGSRQLLAKKSLDYDIFINNSFIDDFIQVFIAKEIWTLWMKNGKKGHLINIGSTAEDFVRPDNRLYSIGKKALKDYSRNLYLYSIWHDSGIKCSHISFGGIQTDKTLRMWPHFTHLEVDFCAARIKDLLETPDGVNIDVIHISPVQPKDKNILKREIKHPNLSEGEFLVSES